jgi:SAM-dependent methyltransferase
MSTRDDDSPKASERRGSIPAPANVPRPSRPAPAPQQASAAPSVPPPSGRKGTLDGIQPNQRAAVFGYAHEPTEDEFDAEKTMVVDHDHDDDAPTQDYDPRTMAQYDPRARGVYASSTSSRPPAQPSERSAAGGAPVPRIPGAPAPPSFDDARPRRDDGTIPAPRNSEAGRRRTSRRTVKIPEDQVSRAAPEAVPAHLKQADAAASEPQPTTALPTQPASRSEASHSEARTETPTETRSDTIRAEAPVPDATPGADTPADGNLGLHDHDSIVDEITVVRPLRIINIGSDPPPPIRSALATWPPSTLLGTTTEMEAVRAEPRPDEIESGWTPAPPEVQAALAADGAAEEALEPDEIEDAPAIEVRTQDERISEIPLSERDEVLEDIEPDAAPFTAPSSPPGASAQPKRPPPPPPKTKAPDAKPGDTRPSGDTQPRKGKPWWEDLFSDEYIRTHDVLEDRIVRREVDFIEESLGMEKHAVVLDLACGMGEHAIELAGRGYSVVGFDNSTGMLSHAEKNLKARLKQSPSAQVPSFVQGDMRELNYEQAFDGVYCWHTSFGYFDEEKNLAVLQQIHRALRQGGMFLLEVVNRDYVSPRSPSLVWFEGQQCVCMDDMYVDFFTSRLRVKRTAMFEGGLSRELDYSIRLYTLHELGKLLHDVGFKVVEVTGHPAHPGVFFGTESPRLIVLAERS